MFNPTDWWSIQRRTFPHCVALLRSELIEERRLAKENSLKTVQGRESLQGGVLDRGSIVARSPSVRIGLASRQTARKPAGDNKVWEGEKAN